jgi:hypothetical protein
MIKAQATPIERSGGINSAVLCSGSAFDVYAAIYAKAPAASTFRRSLWRPKVPDTTTLRNAIAAHVSVHANSTIPN